VLDRKSPPTAALLVAVALASGCGAEVALTPPDGWTTIPVTDGRADLLRRQTLPPALRFRPTLLAVEERDPGARAVAWGEVVDGNLELDDNRLLEQGRALASAYDALLGGEANRFTLGEQRLVSFDGVEVARLAGRYDDRAVVAWLLPGEGQHARLLFDLPARRLDALAPHLEAAARRTRGLSSSFLGRYAIELALLALIAAGLAWMALVYVRHKRAVRAHDAY